MSLDATEARRKAVHVGMASFALLLRWLDVRGAALCALGAFAFNLLVLPRLGGRNLFREGDRARGYPVGILLYPLVVLALVLLFPRRLDLAAAGWGFLAFGDGFATLAGATLGGPRLPWNTGKSWSGLAGYVVFGSLGAAALSSFVAGRLPGPVDLLAFLLAALVGAVLESLPSELDDNLVPPLAAAGALTLLLPALPNAALLLTPDALRLLAVGVGVNVALPALAAALRVVRPSGAVAGGIVGALVLGLGGPAPYALLWAFFAGGTLATRFGRARKEAMGKAEEAGGRRSAANVLANCSVPAFLVAPAALRPNAAPPLHPPGGPPRARRRPAARAARAVAREAGGNPSAGQAGGRAGRASVERARAAVAELVCAFPAEVIFTGGGSEANALALRGAAAANGAVST